MLFIWLSEIWVDRDVVLNKLYKYFSIWICLLSFLFSLYNQITWYTFIYCLVIFRQKTFFLNFYFLEWKNFMIYNTFGWKPKLLVYNKVCFLLLTATTSFTELTFLEEPSDLVVSRGNAATLHCSVQSEAGMPNVIWMKDGKPLGLDDQKYVPSFFVCVPKWTCKNGIYKCGTFEFFFILNFLQLKISKSKQYWIWYLLNCVFCDGN